MIVLDSSFSFFSLCFFIFLKKKDEIRNMGCCRILLKFFFFLKIDIIINVHIVPQLHNKNFNRWIVLEVVVRRLLSYNSFGE